MLDLSYVLASAGTRAAAADGVPLSGGSTNCQWLVEMLTKRATNILNLIVDDYISMGSPISSHTLAHTHALGISSATIRNEVAALEQDGYITRPHTSAGSVPLDKGYRAYVETAAAAMRKAAPTVRRSIRDRFIQVERGH